jgi:hypothetical protein
MLCFFNFCKLEQIHMHTPNLPNPIRPQMQQPLELT